MPLFDFVMSQEYQRQKKSVDLRKIIPFYGPSFLSRGRIFFDQNSRLPYHTASFLFLRHRSTEPAWRRLQSQCKHRPRVTPAVYWGQQLLRPASETSSFIFARFFFCHFCRLHLQIRPSGVWAIWVSIWEWGLRELPGSMLMGFVYAVVMIFLGAFYYTCLGGTQS